MVSDGAQRSVSDEVSEAIESGYGPWFKAKASNGGGCCVEVSFGPDTVRLRDSKWYSNPMEPVRTVLEVGRSQWEPALDRVRAGELTSVDGQLVVEEKADGVTFRDASGDSLFFTPAEYEAFRSGVLADEFKLPDLARSSS